MTTCGCTSTTYTRAKLTISQRQRDNNEGRSHTGEYLSQDTTIAAGTYTEAAQTSFQWPFDPCSTYSEWLRTSHHVDLFWIAGKPGTGKPTLTKLVAQDDRTLNYFQAWAGESKILVASHFFWHPGNAEQRTTSWLLRNLLRQLCDADPELVRIAFEPRWACSEQVRAKPWQMVELWESPPDRISIS